MITRWYVIRPDGTEAVIGAFDLGPARLAGWRVYKPSVIANRASSARSRYNDLRREYVWLCDGPSWSKEWVTDEAAVAAARSRMDKAEALLARWDRRLSEVKSFRPPRDVTVY